MTTRKIIEKNITTPTQEPAVVFPQEFKKKKDQKEYESLLSFMFGYPVLPGSSELLTEFLKNSETNKKKTSKIKSKKVGFAVFSPDDNYVASYFIIPLKTLYSVAISMHKQPEELREYIQIIKWKEKDPLLSGLPCIVHLNSVTPPLGDHIVTNMLCGKYFYRVYCPICDATYESRFIKGYSTKGPADDLHFRCPSKHVLYCIHGPIA